MFLYLRIYLIKWIHKHNETHEMLPALTVLSDPTRQRIVEMLARGALSSGEIASRFDASPPAISQHLRTLREARLVRVRPQAQKRIYELDPAGVSELSEWIARIQSFWSAKLDALEEELAK
ncbi:MAG TPA: metalloregulator ArsR/SmtB family transcription factor [Rhizomicrobium sp.]|nr:metalloregulator ArsR/SmtB family transcription factor [Rhizomicrobium sp.]